MADDDSQHPYIRYANFLHITPGQLYRLTRRDSEAVQLLTEQTTKVALEQSRISRVWTRRDEQYVKWLKARKLDIFGAELPRPVRRTEKHFPRMRDENTHLFQSALELARRDAITDILREGYDQISKLIGLAEDSVIFNDPKGIPLRDLMLCTSKLSKVIEKLNMWGHAPKQSHPMDQTKAPSQTADAEKSKSRRKNKGGRPKPSKDEVERDRMIAEFQVKSGNKQDTAEHFGIEKDEVTRACNRHRKRQASRKN